MAGTSRPLDSGRRDSLGRTVKVADGSGESRSDAPVPDVNDETVSPFGQFGFQSVNPPPPVLLDQIGVAEPDVWRVPIKKCYQTPIDKVPTTPAAAGEAIKCLYCNDWIYVADGPRNQAGEPQAHLAHYLNYHDSESLPEPMWIVNTTPVEARDFGETSFGYMLPNGDFAMVPKKVARSIAEREAADAAAAASAAAEHEEMVADLAARGLEPVPQRGGALGRILNPRRRVKVRMTAQRKREFDDYFDGVEDYIEGMEDELPKRPDWMVP